MKWFTMSLLIVFSFTIKAQTLSKNYIDKWLIQCDTNYKTKLINAYILDGKFYSKPDTLLLNTALTSIPINKILAIDPFWNYEISQYVDAPPLIVVLISTRGGQSQKSKKLVLREAVTKYPKPIVYQNHISKDPTEPVLFINGRRVFHTECYSVLAKLKANSIVDIYYNRHPVPTEYYGQNAKNGLVMVWTK